MNKERLILTVILVISVLYGIFTYWPYLPKPNFIFGKKPTAVQAPAVPAASTATLPGTAERTSKLKLPAAAIKLVDPFSRRVSVRSRAEQAAAAAAAASQPGQVQQVKPFEPKLEGIWVDDAGRKIAFISGQTASVGDRIMGWMVTSILRNQVVIEKGSEYKVLKMEGK